MEGVKGEEMVVYIPELLEDGICTIILVMGYTF